MPNADLVAFSYAGHAFPQGVARGTETLFRVALDRICGQPGFTLPASTGLDAGMWAAENRKKSSGVGWSFHAYGLAIDIAAPWNPFGSARPAASAHRLPANTQELVRPLGLLWGASFDDWMHLEVHASPAECAELTRGLLQGTLFPVPSSAAAASTPGRPFPLPAGYYFGPLSGPNASISNVVAVHADWKAAFAEAQAKLGVVADGLYGPVSAAAIRAYQSAHGLTVDGLLGPNTWRSLFG